MKDLKDKLEKFSSSNFDSREEAEFMEDTMVQFYDEKLRRKYSSILETEQNVIRPTGEEKKKSPKSGKLLLLLAAILVISISLFFLSKMNNKAESPQFYANAAESYYTEIDFATRGEIQESEKLSQIASFYEEKDFSNVSETYKSLTTLDNMEGNYLHAIAISLLNNNETEEAEKLWRMILETEETPFTYHNMARLFLGRMLIESGNSVDEGKSILKEINPTSSAYKDAQDILTDK